ncbi:ABC transporter permease [Litoreibacter janthinus]|uniref:Transport permease protein n=1 Tax=Litoreibacter janthinus TaxID=670154 RepID=A0A1I6ICL4_9RHOB|nr:ABC transporter permease [Litoreibacter janthinus]SFR64507.1 capsular polysaccharide transport system permease protein [Litoreibacter janthinus]
MPFRPVATLMLREIATTHGRSLGGYGWIILEPVAAVSLLSLVFSLFFKNPPLGNSFAMFYASGYLAFATYSDVAQKTALSLRYSRPLLAYPVVNWLDAVLARFALAMLTHTLIWMVVVSGITLVEGLPLNLDPITLAASLVLAALLGLAIGAMNIVLFEFFPVWERVWAIINRPLFMLSGVLFLPDQLPQPYKDWLWYNPIVHVIAVARDGIYRHYSFDPQGVACVIGLALILMVLGIVFLARHARGRILNG